MSMTSATAVEQVEKTLVSGGMLTAAKLTEAKLATAKTKEPLITYLLKNNYISDLRRSV